MTCSVGVVDGVAKFEFSCCFKYLHTGKVWLAWVVLRTIGRIKIGILRCMGIGGSICVRGESGCHGVRVILVVLFGGLLARTCCCVQLGRVLEYDGMKKYSRLLLLLVDFVIAKTTTQESKESKFLETSRRKIGGILSAMVIRCQKCSKLNVPGTSI
jgi:hypothetical protein